MPWAVCSDDFAQPSQCRHLQASCTLLRTIPPPSPHHPGTPPPPNPAADLTGFGDVFPTLAAADPLESTLRLHPTLHGAAVAALQVVTLLLQHSSKGPPGFLSHLLAAIAGRASPGVPPADSASEEDGTPEAQLQELAPQAFAAASGWSCLQSGESDLQLERAVLSCRGALVAAAAEGGLVGPPLAEMRAAVAQGAADLLKESWGCEEEAEEDGRGGCGGRKWVIHAPPGVEGVGEGGRGPRFCCSVKCQAFDAGASQLGRRYLLLETSTSLT
jgi:hypothetical protein